MKAAVSIGIGQDLYAVKYKSLMCLQAVLFPKLGPETTRSISPGYRLCSPMLAHVAGVYYRIVLSVRRYQCN